MCGRRVYYSQTPPNNTAVVFSLCRGCAQCGCMWTPDYVQFFFCVRKVPLYLVMSFFFVLLRCSHRLVVYSVLTGHRCCTHCPRHEVSSCVFCLYNMLFASLSLISTWKCGRDSVGELERVLTE